jgi:hypothetical protein
MSTFFWKEIVLCLDYLPNIILTKTSWDVTPLKKWSGRRDWSNILKDLDVYLRLILQMRN